MLLRKPFFCSVAVLVASLPVQPIAVYATGLIVDEVVITASDDTIRSFTGSAAYLGERSVKEFDSTDLNALLGRVPGVYIRSEDGYGLRPNIGIRGVTSDRSQKITLMEDGILITPAPYSAPAAYYIPNVNRMNAIEVFKGPSAIAYGPHTVGGSLNLVTQPIPRQSLTQLGLTAGSDGFFKARLFHSEAINGTGWGNAGYWIDGLRYQSDGFKQLDGGGETGFKRNDINAKVQWQFGTGDGIYQELQLKLGYADESADETYLGLSDTDFSVKPERRYAASAPDNFDSQHTQLHLIHSMDFKNGWVLTNKAYFNEFERTWLRFADLASGTFNRLFITPQNVDVLTGAVDSSGEVRYANNDRNYGSYGLESRVTGKMTAGEWNHVVTAGARIHRDYIERDHQRYTADFTGGVLSNLSLDTQTSDEKAQTDALSFYVRDELTRNKWTFNAGLRLEVIDGELDSALDRDRDGSNSQTVLIPGVGVFYQWSKSLGLLAGANKGFSPAGPSATADEEESLNFEYGLRYSRDTLHIDLIGFFSDYDNLLGRCRQSDIGCNVGDEFNGGEVQVGGVEFSLDNIIGLGGGWQMPINLVYTYTESAFQQSFVTSFSQWSYQQPDGTTIYPTKGDELPYIPEHQARFQVGIHSDRWAVNAAVKYVDSMREVTGAGELGIFTQELVTLDVGIDCQLHDQLGVKLVVENATDEQKVVSRRPLGARPNAPRTVKLGAIYTF